MAVTVKVDRCPKHDRFRFNGKCLICRDEVASALARDKLAQMRAEQSQ